MDITVKSLTPELAADFFDFFDNRAFSDDSPEGPCYCTRFQMTKAEEKSELFDQAEAYGGGTEGFMRALREIAERQIASSALKGYLAYADDVSIGWCNANDKANFPEESGNGARLYAPAELREKVVICFEIDPNFRGKGVATALLQRVVTDAKAEGYVAVEGFPTMRSERYEWDFHGPVRLYEKVGFTKTGEQGNRAIMRFELQ